MLQAHEATSAASLAALSRNASVISTSSSDSASLQMPLRPPRPIRTFSAPRSVSPNTRTPLGQSPPTYLGELGLSTAPVKQNTDVPTNKARSKSRPRNVGVSVEDFKFGRTLGEGSYSTVKLATHIRTGNQYAIKVLEKVHLIKKDKMSTALAEKNALVKLGAGHPGIVRLYYAFQDDARLYFVIDLARNGEMQTLIARLGSLSIECARYYAAQIVDALEYMHSKGVIHRDLKPENILFDDDFRIKITDFGTGKVLESSTDKAGTWVGTAQYVSPELLEARETSRSSDFWALGCILYQMIAGRFAFQGLSDYLTWQKIKQLEYTFPEGFDSDAKDLVERLLVRDPSQRLGAGSPGSENDIQTLRSHPFFATIDWDTLWAAPHPPIEAGLVQKPPPSDDDSDAHFNGAWDELVRHDGSDDGIEWASDSPSRESQGSGESPQENQYTNGHVDVGPLGEIRRPDITRQETGQTVTHTLSKTQSINTEDTHRHRERSTSTGSPTSSSENGGHIADLTSRMAAFRAPGSGEIPFPEEERGRTQATSPIQGNGPPNPIEYAPLLGLPEGEEVLFYSTVEARSLRRRASRLLPLRVPPSRAKSRELVLTSRRLLCLKHRPKGQGEISVKAEFALRASDKLKEKEKEKDARGTIASVERKSEREFVVLTSSKTISYATVDPNTTATWVEKINNALASNARQLSKGRT